MKILRLLLLLLLLKKKTSIIKLFVKLRYDKLLTNKKASVYVYV